MEALPEAWIDITTRDRTSGTLSRTRIYLPIVSVVEMSITASLTELETIIYKYRNRFIIDLGNVQKYNITVLRVNPPDYDDSSSDMSRWSNGKWYKELESALDVWQNFMYDMELTSNQVGGFRFHYEPTHEEFMPVIDKNVFMVGTMNVSRKDLQTLKVQIPLTVGKMTGIPGTANTSSVDFEPGLAQGETFTQVFPNNFEVPMPAPSQNWVEPDNCRFEKWVSGSESKYAGQMVTWSSSTPDLWTAQWKEPLKVDLIATEGLTEYEIPLGARTLYFIAIGGGGGAGGYGTNSASTTVRRSSGGAGGSGETIEDTWDVSAGGIITIDVGTGGASGSGDVQQVKGGDGENGNPTSVSYAGLVRTAGGGDGGQGSANTATYLVNSKGGQRYYAGGSITQGVPSDGDSADGIAGEAGASNESYGGGAGGGGGDFVFKYNGVTHTSSGGNGGSATGTSESSQISPSTPQYGGGAGSAPFNGIPSGASGAVGLVFFD